MCLLTYQLTMKNEDLIQAMNANKKLLNVIRCHPCIDKTMAARYMNVSLPTITATLNQLVNAKLIKKNLDCIEINSEIVYFIGISVGGSQIKVTIIDMNFKPLSRQAFNSLKSEANILNGEYKSEDDSIWGYVYLDTPADFDVFQRKIDEILQDLIKLNNFLEEEKNKRIYGIGFTFTGGINYDKRSIIKSHNINYLTNKPFDSIVMSSRAEYFNNKRINIIFDHNATSAIIAEKFNLYSNPSFVEKKNIACVYLGSGVGTGFIFDNRLFRSSMNYIGEIGHLKIAKHPLVTKKPVEDKCSCGSDSCLEYRIRVDVFEMTLEKFKSLTSEQLYEEIFDSDKKEYRLEILSDYLGYALNVLINLLNLDQIIFTGKLTVVTNDYELESRLQKQKLTNTLEYTGINCGISSSVYGGLAPSVGAAISSAFTDSSIEWFERLQ